jgi:PAS domain S-box-containing protein
MTTIIDENIDEAENAVCIANTVGRIIAANKRFCKMFGFDQDEVKWHYLCDLYRNEDTLKDIPENEDILHTKMRNRSGRSFPCILTRRATKSLKGTLLLRHSIQRL